MAMCMFADLRMRADLLRESQGKKETRPALLRELAEKAGRRRGGGIALACRAFGVSDTCFPYSLKRDDENEMIADLLVGLTNVHKTWGFGLCFLLLTNVKGHVWNHKRDHRIYCELELNLRIKPRRRLKRDKPTNWPCRTPRPCSGPWTSWRTTLPTSASSGS